MIRHKPLLVFLLAALVCSFAGEAKAERLYSRVSQGNNVGFYLYADWGGPMNWAGGRAAQFPRGSGNLITNDGWQFPICTVRDLNGDGIPEDTASTGDGGRAFMPYYSSIYAEEVLADLYAAYKAGGLNVETATNGNRAGNGISQIWSSLDPDCIATWPREARQNDAPDGDPVIIGSETLFGHFGDSFNTWTENNGFYMGLSFYFTDFGEANNMCFGRGIIHQVTHYVKYRPDPQPAKYQTAKEGWEWVDMTIMINQRATRMAGLDARWAFHPEREIGALWRDGTIASFSPPEPPVITFRMIEKPKFQGQEMNLTNYWTYSGGFGMTGTGYLTNLAAPRQYLATRGEYDAYPGKINPFTGEGNMMGYPGMLKPTDERFGQWLWGPTTVQNNTCWSSLRGMMPRDTTSFDFVMMFVPAEGRQIVPPQTTLDNIDDPVMQQAFARVLDYDIVAQEMYDINLMGPQTPTPPPLTIIPGDREVTITWSDINVKTPDAFYYLLEEKGWNPSGYYREYDFEGYRLYRSYVGPNDSHIDKDANGELKPIFQCSVSQGNLQFHYVDRYGDDYPYYRMRNGLRVWYALVPFDRNYHQLTGEQFSLPLVNSGKTWNRAGTAEAYNVVPRSEASNFRSAELDGEVVFAPESGTPVYANTFELTGDGSGLLTQAPEYLAPVAEFDFVPVIKERIKTARSFSVTAGGFKVYTTAENYGTRTFTLTEGVKSFESAEIRVRQRNANGMRLHATNANVPTITLTGSNTADGSDYALIADIKNMAEGDYRTRLLRTFNTGGYAGGAVAIYASGSTDPLRFGGTAPAHPGQIRTGRFTLSWQSSGAGLTLQVRDVTRNRNLNFTEFPDNYGWGFVTRDNFATMWSGVGTLYTNMVNNVPLSQRTVKMVSTLPADNTESFGIWVNGILYSVGRGGTVTMPASGTVFTIDNAWGDWNSDKTKFTQIPDPPFPGDKWTFTLKPSTLNPEDADLSRIKVVPNPYIATSYLDLSPMSRRIEFVNLPDRCTIRIYSLGGNLVNVLNHIGANRQGWGDYSDFDRLTDSQPRTFTGYDNHGGTEPWNLRNRFGATVASGLYFFHVTDARGKTYTGKFYVVL